MANLFIKELKTSMGLSTPAKVELTVQRQKQVSTYYPDSQPMTTQVVDYFESSRCTWRKHSVFRCLE